MLSAFSNIFELNQSVLSGAMDVIAVKQKDGSIKSTPFYVRFGSLKIIKSKEKIVSLTVNGTQVPIKMKLSSSGDAYFVYEELNSKDLEHNPEVQPQQKTDVPLHKPIESQLKRIRNHFVTSLDESFESIKDRSSSAPASKKKSALYVEFYSDFLNERSLIKTNLNTQLRNNIVSNDLNSIEDKEINDSKVKRRFTDLENETHNLHPEVFAKIIENNSAPEYEISLCLDELIKNPYDCEKIFESKKLKKESFENDFLNLTCNPNLAIKFDRKIYPFKAGEFVLLNKLLFKSEPSEENLNKFLMSNKSGIFGSLRSKVKLPIFDIDALNRKNLMKIEHSNMDEIKDLSANRKNNRLIFPTSNQLSMMNLNPGRNVISFTCYSRITGTKTLTSEIYLWNHDEKIVISDVDGTITKSDVLGQIMPMLGKDWTHDGVSKLFNQIHDNGYKIIYLTARALCQSDITKDYLVKVNQGKHNYFMIIYY